MSRSIAERKEYIIIIALGIILLAYLSYSSIDLASVSITPDSEQTPKTDDDLNCSYSWTGGGASALANVTWYNGSNIFLQYINVTTTVNLSRSHTHKNDVWNCTVIVGNQTESSGLMSDKVTIKNTAPVTPFVQYLGSDIGNSYTLIENQSYEFLLNTSDADGDILSYFETHVLSVGEDYCDIDSGSGIITCIPRLQPNTAVNDWYTFYANDGDVYGVVGTNIYFNVTPVNDPPYFSPALSARSILEGQTLSYNITATDEENSTGQYYANLTSAYTIERLELNSSNNRTFIVRFINNGVAGYGDVGQYYVNISLCDPANRSLCVRDGFMLTVNSTNHPPNLTTIANASGIQNTNFTLLVNASDVDASDTLSFSITALNCPMPNPWRITTLNSSANGSAIINMTLNNTHIYCRNVTVTVADNRGGSTSQIVRFNLTNQDDSPVISNFSFYSMNTNGNSNISNLIAYQNVRMIYRINGSDPDTPIDPFENPIFRDNSSSCITCPVLSIDPSTGILNQTFTLSGNFSYEINLTDSYGNYTRAILRLHVMENRIPQFNQTPTNLIINETDVLYIVWNATDPEGSNVSFSSNSNMMNVTSFLSRGTINHTYGCFDIGNHSIRITISDDTSATNYSDLILNVRNEPQAPVLPDFGNTTILETMQFYRNVMDQVSDSDETCPLTDDSFTFVPVFVGGSEFINDQGIIVFTPDESDQGTYQINITVIDSYGLNSTKGWNLTILNRSIAPQIINLTPWNKPLTQTWILPTLYPNRYLNVNTTENVTVWFDQYSTDPDGDPLFFNWTVNGTVVGYSRNYTRSFGFSDAGVYNVTITVYDNVSGSLDNKVSFSWNLTIENNNRPPQIDTPLPNLTDDHALNGSVVWTNYLTGGLGNIRFYDIDNDTLTYNNSAASFVSIEYSGDDVEFTGLAVGVDNVTFYAFDGAILIGSNVVVINVTGTQNDTVTVQQDTSSGMRIKKKRVTTYIPYIVIEEKKVEKEMFLDILNPEPAVIYNNNTLRQVISVSNSGNKTLKGIVLSAVINSTTAKLAFSNSFFSELLPGESRKTDLIVEDYKLYNNYEILINANITDPAYRDKAVIYINALQKTKGNQSMSATKVTFAQDLLSSNTECIELNEHLKKAVELMQQQDYEGAEKITENVIQACKYLVSQSRLKDDQPKGIFLDIDLLNRIPYLKWALIAFAVLMATVIFFTIRLKKSNDSID